MCLRSDAFRSFGTGNLVPTKTDYDLVPRIVETIADIRAAYQPFAKISASGQASDTLVTKVMLGTIGCLPACDRYFIEGFKHTGFRYTRLNPSFIEQALDFCLSNLRDLKKAQVAIEKAGGVRYPLMKLVDMYFWQIGFDRGGKTITLKGQANGLSV